MGEWDETQEVLSDSEGIHPGESSFARQVSQDTIL